MISCRHKDCSSYEYFFLTLVRIYLCVFFFLSHFPIVKHNVLIMVNCKSQDLCYRI